MSDDSFAPPDFAPASALVQLKRSLRGLGGLAERGGGFELRGQSVITLQAGPTAIEAALARRPGRSPEWDRFTLAGSLDMRRFIDEVRKRLARWDRDE